MEVIYDNIPYKITLRDKPKPEVIELLTSTIWGTDGPLYQHLDTPDKLPEMRHLLSFSLEKQDKIIGTCNFLKRSIIVENKTYHTLYSRYFSIAKKYQGKIFGNLLLKKLKANFEQVTKEPTVFYAYVEQAHRSSRKLLKYTGFDIIRTFETFLFSRIFPKIDNRVTRIQEVEQNRLLELLEEQYKDHVFVNFEPLFFQNNYFVLKINNEIVAGLQANPVKWKISYLPGVSGKIMLHVLPHVPIFSKLFNPKNFQFAAFEGIYCKPGYEQELFRLMESACAHLNLCTGMLWMDSQSALCSRLKAINQWGFMNKLKDDVPAQIVAAFRNIPKNEQKNFYERPAYISAFDLT